MPSEETLLEQAEDWKRQGNEAFQKSELEDAIKAYSQGLVQVDRVTPPPVSLKTALLSNRAACHLKAMKLQPCLDDCTSALDLLQETSAEEPMLRSKLLFRRAKASFMKANMPGVTGLNDLLQGAAKDLLTLLSFDPKNKDASTLLQSIRAQHAVVKKSNTPISKTLDSIKELEDNDSEREHKLKVLAGLIDNDTASGSMELGRIGGVTYLLGLADRERSKANEKIRAVCLNLLANAGSHPPFARTYFKDIQKQVVKIIKNEDFADVVVGGLAIFAKCVLHLDRDHPDKPISDKSDIDHTALIDACKSVLDASGSDGDLAVRGVLENMTVWCCGNDRTFIVRTAIAGDVNNTGILDGIPPPVSKADINAMTPKELALHRQRERDIKERNEKWAKERARLFIDKGGLESMLACAVKLHDHFLRREMTVVTGKILAAFQDEEETKKLVKPYLTGSDKSTADGDMCTIEEVYNDDEEEKAKEVEEEEVSSLQKMMERAELTTSLLLSVKDVGAWAITSAWMDSITELDHLVQSGDDRCLALASEVASAAATVEQSRGMVTQMLNAGSMEKLLTHENRDIRSGAAAAVAKLGLGGKDKEKADEGDAMGMLQVAADLLEDESGQYEASQNKKDNLLAGSFGTSSLERGVEMITYLVSQTQVKEEIAAGFKSHPNSKLTVLEHLVKIAEMPNSGESLTGFGLATIFQHICVTPQTLKEEHFADKELSASDYDELTRMSKTPEERKALDAKKPEDTDEMCAERIRLLAKSNVGRALCQLMQGASDHTLEQIIVGLNRMANEPSVRGSLIQQGALTACIKVDKDPNPSEHMKKIIRTARHTIARILVTMNPSLLTSAQCMGAIKPLILLIRDVEAIDLYRFESLMALTNIGASGEEKKDKIVAEGGIATLNYCMFSQHAMIRKAATEALCNLVGNKKFMEHLANPEDLRLWLAFSADFEEHYECARAASGCLAMATQDPEIALSLVKLTTFQKNMDAMLQSGALEIMHRVFAIILNLVAHGGECEQAVLKAGFAAFCVKYVESYHDGSKLEDLDFPDEQKQLMPVTVDLAKKIVSMTKV